jgi:peroxiredoxin
LAWVALAVAACAGGPAAGGGPLLVTPGAEAKHELLETPAPDFAGDSVNGKGPFALRAARGKVVLVDFWATWCQPCKKSFPKLEELRAKYAASGFEVAAISEDDEPSGVKAFGDGLGVRFSLLWDKDKAIASRWHPPNMPSTFLVDTKGVVRFVHLGYHEGEERDLEAEIKSLL